MTLGDQKDVFHVVYIHTDDTWVVRDLSGATWWPDDDLATELRRSPDPENLAVEACTTAPMRGTWHT